jgi:hypothetical protein
MSFLQDAESSLAPSITQESTTTSQADKRGKKSSPVWAHYVVSVTEARRGACYAELYLRVSSSSLRTTRLCASVVLVSRVEGEGFNGSIYD